MNTHTNNDRPIVEPDFETVIIGAGIGGIQQLYWIKKLGLSVRLFEAGSGVGGTWYWNRYPGCRLDSESESYVFGFSEELLQEWDWTDHFASQPELERYMNFVVDRFELRPDIQLDTEVVAATWNEDGHLWDLTLSTGDHVTCRFVLAAVGVLSAPASYVPDFEGVDSFEGETYHSAHWPRERVDLEGKRVGIIGTGSTGVQIIQTIAPHVGHLTVFQRTPTYVGPLYNSPVTTAEQAEWKRSFDAILARCAETSKGFIHQPDPRKWSEVPAEERRALYELYWHRPGFQKYLRVFHDLIGDPEANAEYADFWREKMRERVNDPEVAEKLMPPKSLPFGARRIPLETGYLEVYNRSNVTLVDVKQAPIERITPNGVKTADAEYELDVLIFATGFDSFTGGFTRIDVRGPGSMTLKEKWEDEGPVNYLSMMTAGFPNFFTVVSRLAGNYARTTEAAVGWLTDTLKSLHERGITRIVPSDVAEDHWVEHELSFVKDLNALSNAPSWFNGGNIPGKKLYPAYNNTLPAYRRILARIIEEGMVGFELANADGTLQLGDQIALLDEILAGGHATESEVSSVENLQV